MTEGTTSGAETTYPSATPMLTLRFSIGVGVVHVLVHSMQTMVYKTLHIMIFLHIIICVAFGGP
jgi:hypothetical protein